MQRYRIISITFAAALLFSATPALAERGAGSGRASGDRPNVAGNAARFDHIIATSTRPGRGGENENAGARGSGRGENAHRGNFASTTLQERQEAVQEKMEHARKQMKERADAMREKAAERIARIEDRTKQKLAERLAARFDDLNKTWTDHFAKLLDRFDAILQKIQNRADRAAGNGADVSSVNAAIAHAHAAIASARDAVLAQAAKTYALDTSSLSATTSPATSSEASSTPGAEREFMQELRSAFKNLHDSLFTDLFALRDGPMKSARQSVHDALQALKGLRGDAEGEATSTAETATSTAQ